MASANRYPGIDPQIVRCVRHHARRVRTALPGMEIEDIEQELMLHVHRRLSRFDATRGSLRTFVDRIVRNCAANLLQSLRSEKRGFGVEFISLDTIAGDAADSGPALADSDEGACAGGAYVGYAPEDLLNLRIELWRTFNGLSSPLRSCLLGLFGNTVADTASRTGVSRSTLYERIAEIREG
ncbi:MAG: RNA polymerase sigma factor, partial [Candidatus Binatia bacterium]